MVKSVHNKDYLISMYELLGNSQSPHQFANKYYGVFIFMLNKYMKQVLGKNIVNNLQKVILTLKKEKNMYIMVDLSEKERGNKAKNCHSPIRDFKALPEYSNILVSSKCNL